MGSFSPSNLWGLFFGLHGDWSGKRAKVFPGKHAGLSGDATLRALLAVPFGDTSGLPLIWSWGDPSLGDPVTYSQLGMGRLSLGSSGPKSVRLCGFASNKEIRCNPPNLLSISLLPAPRPACPARREAREVRAASSHLRPRLGSTSVRVCLLNAFECVNVHGCVVSVCACAALAAEGVGVDFAAWAAREGRPRSPPPPLEET